jgi:hypothetical protein
MTDCGAAWFSRGKQNPSVGISKEIDDEEEHN